MDKKALFLLLTLAAPLPATALTFSDDACLDAVVKLAVAGLEKEATMYHALTGNRANLTQQNAHNNTRVVMDQVGDVQYTYDHWLSKRNHVQSAMNALQFNDLCLQLP